MTKILIDRSTLASAQEALAELLPDERDTNCDGHDARDVRWWRAVEKALKAALAEPVQVPAPMPPFPPVSLWKRGCAVCGIGAGGHAYGYACPRSDCPTRVTCGGTV